MLLAFRTHYPSLITEETQFQEFTTLALFWEEEFQFILKILASGPHGMRKTRIKEGRHVCSQKTDVRCHNWIKLKDKNIEIHIKFNIFRPIQRRF